MKPGTFFSGQMGHQPGFGLAGFGHPGKTDDSVLHRSLLHFSSSISKGWRNVQTMIMMVDKSMGCIDNRYFTSVKFYDKLKMKNFVL